MSEKWSSQELKSEPKGYHFEKKNIKLREFIVCLEKPYSKIKFFVVNTLWVLDSLIPFSNSFRMWRVNDLAIK